jgi:hypothetical protein
VGIIIKNNAKTTLSAGISSTDTTISVDDVSSFPALGVGDYFYLTLETTTGAHEIVKVTQVNASSFLVVRGQETTIPIPFVAGARAELRITEQSLEDQFGVAVPAAVEDYIDTLDLAYLNVIQDWTARQTFNDGVHVNNTGPTDPAQIVLERDGNHRWAFFRNSTAESGADAGSNFDFYSYDDTGSLKDLIFRVTRSTGVLNFGIQPTISGSNILKATDIGSSVQAYDADTAKLDVVQTWSALQTFSGAGNSRFVNTTDAADNIGLIVESDRATPAANDRVLVDFRLSDSAGNQDTFVQFRANANTVTSGAETGAIYLGLVNNGTLADRFYFSASELLPLTDNSIALGRATNYRFADLFLGDGAVINFNNGDISLTHSADALAMGGGQFNVYQGVGLNTPTIRCTNTTDAAQVIAAAFEGDRATPTAGDSAIIPLRLSDSAGNQDPAAQIQWGFVAVTSGSETGYLRLALMSSGTLTNRLDLYNTNLSPVTSDGLALGTTTTMWSDLFLASGGVINFNNGDVTLTHSSNALTGAGGQLLWNYGAAGATAPARFTNTFDTANNVALIVESDRATPTAYDLAWIDFYLSNSAGSQTYAASYGVAFSDITAGSVDSVHYWRLVTNSVTSDKMYLSTSGLAPYANDGLSLGFGASAWADLYLASGGVINFNNGDVTITHSADALTFGGAANGFVFNTHVLGASHVSAHYATAMPAGGTAGAGIRMSSTTNFGVFFGSGAPTLSAAQGSLYLRSDGSSTSTRMYVNTNGSTTWTAVTTAA